MQAGLHYMASLQRHGSLRVAVTEEDRQAGQDQADTWSPPRADMRPHATVTLGEPSAWLSGSGEYPQVEITSDHIRQLVADSEKAVREHQQGKRAPEQYTYHGKTYRTTVKGSSVNASYAMEDIHDYVSHCP